MFKLKIKSEISKLIFNLAPFRLLWIHLKLLHGPTNVTGFLNLHCYFVSDDLKQDTATGKIMQVLCTHISKLEYHHIFFKKNYPKNIFKTDKNTFF